jgi:hypothetical protein
VTGEGENLLGKGEGEIGMMQMISINANGPKTDVQGGQLETVKGSAEDSAISTRIAALSDVELLAHVRRPEFRCGSCAAAAFVSALAARLEKALASRDGWKAEAERMRADLVETTERADFHVDRGNRLVAEIAALRAAVHADGARANAPRVLDFAGGADPKTYSGPVSLDELEAAIDATKAGGAPAPSATASSSPVTRRVPDAPRAPPSSRR